ncbi:hypothetical protein CBR_g17566 [Chara braunii]|uniref:Malic enzyme n=1 Tax=Chara braunii TaxID=69332 RepID=A0A388KUW6_CHABU|nr:hypothetical protein CBR_g17566 [Chara braunii]|eukprot:GBG73855.1 hypothetical protein CBR_g17566 [Chara braunii]
MEFAFPPCSAPESGCACGDLRLKKLNAIPARLHRHAQMQALRKHNAAGGTWPLRKDDARAIRFDWYIGKYLLRFSSCCGCGGGGGGGGRDFKEAAVEVRRCVSMASTMGGLVRIAVRRGGGGRIGTWARALLSADMQTRRYCSLGNPPILVQKRGSDILHDPWLNKGTAHPSVERDSLGLRGLLPPSVISLEQQVARFGLSFRSLERKTREGESDERALAQWRLLNRLHDRNETLYYKVLIDNIKEFAPIVYTPTVGLVCQNYSGLFRRSRGMYFSAKDKGLMASMVYNWPSDKVDVIVVTDGSRILGLGDLGVQGIGIPIGKLDLYVAAGGINPSRVLPVCIDVGTNNAALLENPLYKGLRQPRLEGDEYLSVIDEFMEAVYIRWPKVIVQHEDFQNKWAFSLLKRYRNKCRMFNDDVQGTAGVALAGILGAVRAMGRPMSDISKMRIVVVGAGSAGLGVVNMVRESMAMTEGVSPQTLKKAAENFWIMDSRGLVTESRKDMDPDVKDYARSLTGNLALPEGAPLLDVVKKVKPDVLLGLSGVGGIFNKQVLEAMKHERNHRPAVFAMSNPTSNAECSSTDCFNVLGANCVFASGSPFPDVALGDGSTGKANQGNNMYLFPGIGLGTCLAGSRLVTDGMLHAAAERLASMMSAEDVAKGIIFPPVTQIRDVAKEVGAAVVKAAVDEDLAEGTWNADARDLRAMSQDDIVDYVDRMMWSPAYSPLIYSKSREAH